MTDEPKRPSKPPTGRFGRLWRLGALAPRAVRAAFTMSAQNPDEMDEKTREKLFAEARKTADVMLKTLGEMKGLPLKLGQMASYIDGLAPPGYEEKFQLVLKQLQQKAPPLSAAAARKVIVSEFNREPEAVFAKWEVEPFAAASIGQVHRAVTHSGNSVAVKVQYPGIDTAIENDLKTIALMEGMFAPIGRRFQTKEGLVEVRQMFMREVDYMIEAASQEAFEEMWADDDEVIVPRVHRKTSTRRVLTTDYIEGLDFQTFCAKASYTQRSIASRIIWTFMFRSLYEFGVLYADPHPGNYRFILDDKDHDHLRVAFLDYGCVRVLSDQMVAGMKRVVLSLIAGDEDAFDRGLVEVYGFDPTDPEGWPMYRQYVRQLWRPIAVDEPYCYTKDNARENVAYLVRGGKKMMFKEGSTLPNLPRPLHMPVENTFINRLQWGLASILAALETDYNYHRLSLRWLQGPRTAPPGLEVPPPA